MCVKGAAHVWVGALCDGFDPHLSGERELNNLNPFWLYFSKNII